MAKQAHKPNEISTTVAMHQHFYRDQYRRLVFMTGFVTLANIFCGLIIVFLLLEHPSDEYISAEIVNTNTSNPSATHFSITPRVPLTRANMQKMELTQWVVDAVTKSFTYTVQTYSTKLNENKYFYTDAGWREYTNILNNMVRFDTYTSKQVLISVVRPIDAPTLFMDGEVINGVYTWIYNFPIRVEFSGSVDMPAQTMTLHITVARTSMENDVDGVKITGIEALNIKRRQMPATPSGIQTQ